MPMQPIPKPASTMTPTRLTGTFSQIIYSPKGGVEGLLLSVAGAIVQLVIAKEDEKAAALVSSLSAGQTLVVSTLELPPSSKGPGEHPVRALQKITRVDGATPAKIASRPSDYTGRIVRFNYARHGAPNGYVLDSGDFIHVRPEGFAKLKLRIGDSVTAEGDAHFLSTGGGWAVEASAVKRVRLK
jgi:hypothetical protein